jgi:hypothetical protein
MNFMRECGVIDKFVDLYLYLSSFRKEKIGLSLNIKKQILKILETLTKNH